MSPSTKCIQNCFRKAGFTQQQADASVSVEQSSSALERDFNVAQDLNIFPREISPHEYCAFDDRVSTSRISKD